MSTEKTVKKEKTVRRVHGEEGGVRFFDYTLVFIIIFLVGFGLIMLYSVSSYEAFAQYGDAAYFLKKQMRGVVAGLIGMGIITVIPYYCWKKVSWIIYFLALILCIYVIFAGSEINGSSRWIEVGGFSFQPSEVAKIALIIFMAARLSRMPKQIGKFWTLIKVLLLAVPFVIVIGYGNLSTAVIIGGICVLMCFVTSPKYSHFLGIIALIVAMGGIGIAAMSYRMVRVQAWLNPENYPDDAYQTLQGLYAIGSGGLFGKGLGESIQKMGYVPYAQNDFIFTIICEELGIFGAVCLIILFVLLIWRFMVIAGNAPDLFGALLVVGVMSHIALQLVLNLAVVTNTIPNTGVTLPFFSYGGTSLMILLMEMGLVLSVSRGIRLEDIRQPSP